MQAISNAYQDGRYRNASDPTLEVFVQRRLRAINEELQQPPLDGVDIRFVGSAIASLAARVAPFHAQESTSPAAQAMVEAVGEDPSGDGVPTRVLEQFERPGGPLAVLGHPAPPTTPQPEQPASVLNDTEIPGWGPTAAGRRFGWVPTPGEAADAITIAAGVKSITTTVVAAAGVTAATGASATAVTATSVSVAVLNLLLLTVAYIWRRKHS